jgi:hypothetical protein
MKLSNFYQSLHFLLLLVLCYSTFTAVLVFCEAENSVQDSLPESNALRYVPSPP